ncbi:MAG: hypothetical protein R3E82_08725 [Pseudomonadales bacterium]
MATHQAETASVIPYIERTRNYYGTLGYPPYHWAHNETVPFTPFRGAVRDARLALITTAAPNKPELGDQGPGAAYNAAAKFFQVYTVPKSPAPDLRISHLGYDRKHSTAEDPNSWLPVAALEAAVAEERLGALADSLIGVPTNRSQRVTLEKDAPDALAACIALDADIALLVPS